MHDPMRVCSKCSRAFQGDERVCPHDGTPLDRESPDERAFATTAFGPADVRDTPIVTPDLEVMTRPDDDGTDPLIGKTLRDRFRVESKLGEGGMGAVYVAEHVKLRKRVALKVLHKHAAQQKSAVERLQQEAIAASQIEHDNIVAVLDCDLTEDGSVFIAMELLRGEDLAALIGRGPLPLDRALGIAYQICRALEAAHASGIVHRDLKPENVFITRKGDSDFVKVLDFGISKVKTADAEQVRMTKTGQIVGTPLYMSPEQAKGETDLDHRTDVYALGIILYEMLTGVPPFNGDNYFQVIWQHTNETPTPPRKRNPNVPVSAALEAVVLKALAKDRDVRYQSMAEVERALTQAVPHVAPPSSHLSRPSLGTAVSLELARGARPQKRSPAVLAGVGAAVLLAGAVGVWLAVRGLSPGGPLSPPDARLGGIASEPRTDPGANGPTGGNDPGETPPPPTPPRTPPAAPAPTLFRIAFDSSPAGARVLVGDRELGTTPFEADLAQSEVPLEAKFELRGHVGAAETFVPARGVRVAARLRPVRRSGGDEPPGGTKIKGW